MAFDYGRVLDRRRFECIVRIETDLHLDQELDRKAQGNRVEDLLRVAEETDFASVYRELAGLPMLEPRPGGARRVIIDGTPMERLDAAERDALLPKLTGWDLTSGIESG